MILTVELNGTSSQGLFLVSCLEGGDMRILLVAVFVVSVMGLVILRSLRVF